MALILMQSVTVVSAQTVDSASVVTNVAREQQLLNLLGINISSEENYINRGEFAVLVAGLMGNASNVSDVSTSFSDISEYYTYKNEVELVKQRGLMTGYGDKFEPVKPITLQEALKVLVTLAGYGELADAKGGYPSGYISVSNTLKLTRGIKCNYGEGFDVNMAYKLAFNLLEAPVYEISSVSGDGSVQYSPSADTYAKKYFDIFEISGRVVATSVSALLGHKIAPKGKVTIGNKSYNALPSIGEYLGQNVDAYIRDLGNENYEVIYCEANDDTEIVHINKKEVISIKGFDSTDSVQYKRNPKLEYASENGKVKSLTLGGNLQVAYNGVITANIQNADFTNNCGYVDVIDTDNNGTYDFVSITNYVSYAVSRVDAANKRLVFKNGGEFTLGDQKIVSVIHENRIVDFNDILKDTVVSVRTSKIGVGETISDSSVIYIDMTMDSMDGKISEISTDKNEVIINGTLYEYDESVEADMIIGVPYKYYLDIFGRICFAEQINTVEGEYYFFVKSGMTQGMDGKFQMQFVNLNQEVIVFTMPETVIYTGPDKNGNWVVQTSCNQEKLVDIFAANFTGRHLFKLVLSEDGNLEQIIAPFDGTATTDYAGYSDEFSLDRTTTTISAHDYCIDNVYRYNAGIPIFVNNTAGDASDVKVLKTSSNVPGNVRNNLNSIQVYDASNALEADILVANITATTGGTTSAEWNSGWETYIFVLDKITKALDEDGDATTVLNGWENGVYLSYNCANDNIKDIYSNSPFVSYGYKTELKDLTRGDALMLSKNNNNEVDGFMSVLTFTNNNIPTDYRDGSTYGGAAPCDPLDPGALLVTYYDKISKCYDKTFRLTNDPDKIIPITATVYMYDIPNDEIKKLSLEDAYGLLKDSSYTNPDYVLVRQRRSQQIEMIIYRR